VYYGLTGTLVTPSGERQCSMLLPPNTRNHAKFRHNSTLQQFKVIQGHQSWRRSKAHICDFLLVINGNFSSGTDFEILTLKARKWLILPPPLFEAPYLPNPCEYLHNPYIARNYIHWTTFPMLTVWVYLHSFSCCSLPKTRNHAIFRENSTLQQFKVIQGHRSWCQSKAHMWLPISDQ